MAAPASTEHPIVTIVRHLISRGPDGAYRLEPEASTLVTQALLGLADHEAEYAQIVVGLFGLAAWLYEAGSKSASAGLVRAVTAVHSRLHGNPEALERLVDRRAPMHDRPAPKGAIPVYTFTHAQRRKIQ
jgi:hypothetical protein